ncbi:MAG: CPBP family intramembrane metalloprotease [Myxococcota bacterium]|nr:CPBP family intramembrane metalloprotease [Myxococcota bacterium]
MSMPLSGPSSPRERRAATLLSTLSLVALGAQAVLGVTPIATVPALVAIGLAVVAWRWSPRALPLTTLIAIWRGVIQDRLEPLVGVSVAVVLQAISFGTQHAHGVPRGLVGVLLAGTWALMLGALRHRSGGLLAPLIAHIIADAAIAILVLTLALGG